MDVLTYARYILETALLEYKFNVAVSESKLAAAALVLAFKVNKIDNGWVNTLAFYSGYTPSEVADLVQSLFEMLQQYPKENLKTVRQKYSHRYEMKKHKYGKIFHDTLGLKMFGTGSLFMK